MTGYIGRGRHRQPKQFASEEEAIAHFEQANRNRGNRNMGEFFEKQLEAYHARLKQEGKALVLRQNPDYRMTGASTAVILGKGPVDYIGILPDGRSVHFDAKARQGDRFSLDKRAKHQHEHLELVHSWGHLAGWLAYWHELGEYTWHTVPSVTTQTIYRKDGVVITNGGIASLEWLSIF